MVHALTESHRVLRPHGHVVDLHPERGPGRRRARRLPVYIAAGYRLIPAGTVPEPADYYGRYLAADRAVERVLRDGLFTLQASEVFPLRYYFRSLPAMAATIEKEWIGMTLGETLRRRLQTLLRSRPPAQIVVVEPFRLNLLQKR
jgi:hypothetical protein